MNGNKLSIILFTMFFTLFSMSSSYAMDGDDELSRASSLTDTNVSHDFLQPEFQNSPHSTNHIKTSMAYTATASARAQEIMNIAIKTSDEIINAAEQGALSIIEEVEQDAEKIKNCELLHKNYKALLEIDAKKNGEISKKLTEAQANLRIVKEDVQELKNKVLDAESILFGVPHKIDRFSKATQSIFTGEKGQGAQATAIVATVAAAAALTYVVGRSQGVFLTNEEKIANAQEKLFEANVALEVAIKTKEKSSDKAEIKTLNIKILALKAKVAAIEKNIEKLKTKK